MTQCFCIKILIILSSTGRMVIGSKVDFLQFSFNIEPNIFESGPENSSEIKKSSSVCTAAIICLYVGSLSTSSEREGVMCCFHKDTEAVCRSVCTVRSSSDTLPSFELAED